MFTGLIEEIGNIKSIVPRGSAVKITITAQKVLEDLQIDHSIAVNGVCLTATKVETNWFTVDAVAETLSKTTLVQLKNNEEVNLERAMRLQDRLGGHLVQGHVDGIGKIMKLNKMPDGSVLEIKIPEELKQYTIQKGSIAIDGISLTIAEKYSEIITMAVIPHTMQHTILKNKKQGDSVNIEVDFFAKYIEQFINKKSESKITMDWLKQQGY